MNQDEFNKLKYRVDEISDILKECTKHDIDVVLNLLEELESIDDILKEDIKNRPNLHIIEGVEGEN